MRQPNTYYLTVRVPKSAKEPDGRVESWTDTVGRRAVVDVRKRTHACGIGAKGDARVQQRGSLRKKLLHQCYVRPDGTLSPRGVEL